jgi:hypothetical protein
MNILKNLKFSEIIILILLIVILFQKCGGNKGIKNNTPKIITKIEWRYKDSIVKSVPQIIKSIPINIYHDNNSKEYLPDSNYAELLKQYISVTEKYLSKNILQDSIRIDSVGYFYIKDTVSHNVISGRETHYNIKYPIITNNIIYPYKSRRQVYVGGWLQGNQYSLFNQINIGILYKNKKDLLFGAAVGLDVNKGIEYSLHSYWKIKL